MSAAKTEGELKPDPRQVRAARRLWFKERVYESRALQKIYASVAGARARASLRRGGPYEAADILMRAWRHLGSEGLGARKVERVRALVRGGCSDGEGRLLPASENRLRLDFVRTEKARELRRLYGSFPEEHRRGPCFPRTDPDLECQRGLSCDGRRLRPRRARVSIPDSFGAEQLGLSGGETLHVPRLRPRRARAVAAAPGRRV